MSSAQETRKLKSAKADPRRKMKDRKTTKPRSGTGARKVFGDTKLYGAVPGMAQWAMEELKEMRDEW